MEDLSNSVIFPLGELVSANAQGFTGGEVWSHMFTPFHSEYNCPVGNVTYSPGSRNCWHTHPGGQILLVTGGRGWYQEEGKAARELHAGDCVLAPPNCTERESTATSIARRRLLPDTLQDFLRFCVLWSRRSERWIWIPF